MSRDVSGAAVDSCSAVDQCSHFHNPGDSWSARKPVLTVILKLKHASLDQTISAQIQIPVAALNVTFEHACNSYQEN